MSRHYIDHPPKPRNLYSGSPILAADSMEHVSVADPTEQANVTSTSFVPWDPEITTLFIAPTSGRVLVLIRAGFDEDAGETERGVVAPQIRKSDRNGPIHQDAGISANSCSSSSYEAPLFQYVSRLTVVEGLQPGHIYWAQVMVLVSGGSNVDISNAQLHIIPTQ